MSRLRLLSLLLLSLALLGSLLAFQGRRFHGYEAASAPSENAQEKTEFAFFRLRYNSGGDGGFDRGWWATDFPKSDRQFVMGVRRLTRIQVHPTEHVADVDSDDIYDSPWIYVEFAGGIWYLTESQAGRLRNYLLRGGFLMLDDLHGVYQFEGVMAGVRMIFPDRSLEELSSSDPIFHVLYDLDERLQVPGTRFLTGNGGVRYPADARVPRWLGIRDDRGRIILAICDNSDVGDAWEWADSPYYPERYASFAYRLGINYIIYGMTH